MAVTTTYAFQLASILDLTVGPATNAVDVVSLDGGGFVAVGNDGGDNDVNVFDANGNPVGSNFAYPGFNPAISKLANGNFVVAAEDGGLIRYSILDSTGADVAYNLTASVTNASNVDVVGLANGDFWIVYDQFFSGTDFDIRAVHCDGAGNEITTFSLDSSLEQDERPSITALDNGNVAITWTRTDAFGETEVWYGIYDQAGSVVLTPTTLLNFGTIADSVSVTAMNGGGFAIAYRDNGWDGDVDITIARFDQDGFLQGETDVAQGTEDDSTPYVTRLANGFLAVAYHSLIDGDNDVIVKLIDPATGAVLASETMTAGESIIDEQFDAAIAGFGEGMLAAFWSNGTDNDIDGQVLQGVRNSTGDAAADNIFGDDFIDVMTGGDGIDFLDGGGNADNLSGDAGSDTLDGADGDDILSGGDGNDIIYGGFGTDQMDGGLGDDTFIVGEATDVVTELVGGGTDTVITTLSSYTLGLNVNNLTFSGVGARTGTGNELGNVIKGLASGDNLIGAAGNDTLIGGAGGDILNGGAGSDTASYAGAAARVKLAMDGSFAAEGDALGDTLISIASVTGTSLSDVLRGDANANTIRGGSGSDTIQGMAGNDNLYGETGSDALTGGLGNDFFSYSALTHGGDTIKDFSNVVGNDDALRFTGSVFGGLPVGVLAANHFRANTTGLAGDADDRFIYETDTGILRYDANGNAGGGVTVIATLTGAPLISAADILII